MWLHSPPHFVAHIEDMASYLVMFGLDHLRLLVE
jgi:hypothetical protein